MKAILFPLFFLSALAISCSISSSKKTTKLTFNSGELLYTDSITETQAKALGDYLVKTGFYDGKEKTVQLSKENGTIHFAMILNDSLANSEAYHNVAIGFIDDLQQNVFKGSTVEVDFCDEYMKVKKNIKGESIAMDNTNTTEVTNVSGTETEDNMQFLPGYYTLSNISGGNVGAAEQAHDNEILQGNFTFNFGDDGTFTSQFINQNDYTKPIPVKGVYAINNNKIEFSGLSINGQPTEQGMSFDIKMPTGDQLQLISKPDGVKDIIMTFERQQ